MGTRVAFVGWAEGLIADSDVVPRATGRTVEPFRTAGAMAAIVSGCYVVSSNRVGKRPTGRRLAARALPCAPNGALRAMTAPEGRRAVIELDLAAVRAQHEGYACYVRELS